MTIEPTTDGSAAADDLPAAAGDAPATEASVVVPKRARPAKPAESAKPKVTRARARTSGAAPRGRPKAQTAAVREAASLAAATATTKRPPKPVMAVVPAPPSAVVPVPETPANGGDTVRADRVDISQGGAGSVEATTVTVSQGGIGSANARTIDVRQGGIGNASATDIAVSGGSIGLARGERVSLEMGAVAAAIGDDVRVTQSMSSFVVGRGEVTVDQSLVGTLVGDKVTIRQPSAVLLLIARQVDGTVRPLLDWRGALAAGAVAGVVIGLLQRARR